MSLLGNIIWLIFGGLLASLGYILFGALLCITVVGIPFGMQAIRLGVASFAPFGKRIVPAGPQSTLKLLFDIIWILLFGWEIAMVHLTFALILAITIVGLPFAKQHLKMVPLALFPFSQELR
ncbi:MAG TPA: YccF domain-containing protein [Chloroflexi bacterium]|nr:YccF domain-containing protein [Chloroflexota bacterium]